MVGWHHRLNGHESLGKVWEIANDRDAWHAAVHGVTKSRTRLNDSTTTATILLWTPGCVFIYKIPFVCIFSGGGGLVIKSCPTLVTLWTVGHQASLSMGFPRWHYCSRLPFRSPGDLPNPGIKPWSPELQAVSCIAGEFFTDWATFSKAPQVFGRQKHVIKRVLKGDLSRLSCNRVVSCIPD